LQFFGEHSTVVPSLHFSFLCRPPPQNQPFLFEHLTVDDGLSQNSVNAVLEDHKGFLWFGTADGLNKYDGYQFKTYKSYSRESLTLSSNTIRTLYEDHSGTLWIGTGKGLNGFNRKVIVFTNILKDGKGILWVGGNEGLKRCNRNKEELERRTVDVGHRIGKIAISRNIPQGKSTKCPTSAKAVNLLALTFSLR
jgi:ligand-binding sensor domain-containing protein